MKLTLIGGAGVRTPLLVSALARRQEAIGIERVTLVDIDEQKLEIIGPLARFAAERAGARFGLSWTSNSDEALRSTDAVITTIRVGGDASRATDERIALEHGVIGQETTGPGGFAMALRSIPVVTEYARRMCELCPDAWLLNFTNPAGLVTQALTEEFPGLKIAGICDTPISMWRDVAAAFECRAAEMPITFFGLNHLSWMSEAWIGEENVVPRVLDDECIRKNIHELSMFEPRLLRLIRAIPNEYLYYYYYRDRALSNMQSASEVRGEQVLRLGKALMRDLAEIDPSRNPGAAWARYARYRDGRHGTYMAMETGHEVASPISTNAPATDGTSIEDEEGYAGVALDILSAAATGETAALVANVPNRGAIPGMRDDDVVEVVCRSAADGLEPVPVKDVPEDSMLLMQQVKRYERLTVEAVRARSRELAVGALMAHPLVGSYSLAASLVSGYLDVHEDTLGEWR